MAHAHYSKSNTAENIMFITGTYEQKYHRHVMVNCLSNFPRPTQFWAMYNTYVVAQFSIICRKRTNWYKGMFWTCPLKENHDECQCLPEFSSKQSGMLPQNLFPGISLLVGMSIVKCPLNILGWCDSAPKFVSWNKFASQNVHCKILWPKSGTSEQNCPFTFSLGESQNDLGAVMHTPECFPMNVDVPEELSWYSDTVLKYISWNKFAWSDVWCRILWPCWPKSGISEQSCPLVNPMLIQRRNA